MKRKLKANQFKIFLVFFEDADTEPELKMIKPIQWNKIKRFFKDRFIGL